MNNSPQNTELVVTHRPGLDSSDEEEWSGAVLERSKSDRIPRADEDRRRRTIIVEKKNGTYGFTLQSYGIHYKREQEIEMVTYVDYIEYDGPAFKAGMREGDVILSINGHEMDRADHKTLVSFIKNCDARMRMVVLFEDCVKKVELHMRYIELQRALQSRLGELERLCERERSILMGRWKTHSLPARKRTPSTTTTTSNQSQSSPSSSFASSATPCCRPAASTEHLLLYSVYADGRPCLVPRSAACLVTIGPPRSRSDHHHFLSKVGGTNEVQIGVSTSRYSYHQANGIITASGGGGCSKSQVPQQHSKSPQQHQQQQQQQCSMAMTSITEPQSAQHASSNNGLCVACIPGSGGRREPSEGGSLDAYDLASPCCDPNCVPSRRRREKQRRARHEQTAQQQQQQQQQHQQREQQQQQQQQQQQHVTHVCPRASGHSLHSITSSEVSTAADSVASCSTSLSTDTLYWDPSAHQRPPACLQYAKPKSWDNLTTKAFGGYGFGYGYLDTGTIKTHSAERPPKSGSHSRSKTPSASSGGQRSSRNVQSNGNTTAVYVTHQRELHGCSSSSSSHPNHAGTGMRQFQPTKSTESLLLPPTAYLQEDLDASHSCECLDGPSPRFVQVLLEKHKRQDSEVAYVSSGGSSHSQPRHRRASHSEPKLRSAVNNSEVTRL